MVKKKKLKVVKNIFIAVVTALVFVAGFDGLNCVCAKSSISLDTARNVAKSKLYWYPEWALAEIGTATVYYDLKDNPSAYIFKVVKENKTLGYISINARSDYFPIIEFALGSIIPSDLVNRCREIASSKSTGKLGQPKLLYLGGIDYLVSFPVEGTEESITIGLKSGIIYSKENLDRMQERFDSRTDEQIARAKKAWSGISGPKKAPKPLQQYNEKYLSGVEGYTYYRGGGPPSAAMLLNYYGTMTSPLGYYPNLYYRAGTFTWYGAENGTYTPYCPRRLVDYIADHIGLPNRGGKYEDYGVTSSQIAGAIDEIAKLHGYIFRSSYTDSVGSLKYSERFKSEIDANRPFLLALGEALPFPKNFSITFAFGYKYKKTPTQDEHWIRVYNPYSYLENYGNIGFEDILLENQYGIFAVFSTPPPVDTEPDKINVYHYQEPVTRHLTYPIPLFKQGANVYVTVSDGTTTGLSLVAKDIYVTQLSRKSTVTVTVRDDGTEYDMRAYDGTYTGMFNFDAVDLGNGERGIITANLNDGTMYGSFTIIAEYIPPAFIEPPTVSKYIFSPNITPGTTTISFTARDDLVDGTWTYKITIDDGIIPFGAGSTGSCKGSTSIAFDWNGKDKAGNLLADGTHTITVVIGDLAENFETKTTQVIIDTTSPVIEDAKLSDYYFSPPAPKGTTTITFTGSDTYGTWAYALLVGTRTLCGSGSPTGTLTTRAQISFDWNGKVKTNSSELLLGEGTHIITILLTDVVGNTSSTSLSVSIDKTLPQISEFVASRYIFSPSGIYPNTTLSFTGSDVDSPWKYSILVDGQTPGGAGEPTGTRTAGTSSISFTWNGSPVGEGTHTITLTITDFASNTVSTSTTIIIDTTKPVVTNFYASSYTISSDGTSTITFTCYDNRGTWSYKLSTDERDIQGATGTVYGNQTIKFILNGSEIGDGVHLITLTIMDLAGNISTATLTINIGITGIDIITLYQVDWTPANRFRDNAVVYITVKDGISKSGEKTVYIRNRHGTFTLVLNDNRADVDQVIDDGTYTGKFIISSDSMTETNLQMNDGERTEIVIDLDGRNTPGSTTIIADYTAPDIVSLSVSDTIFSPKTSPGVKDSITISFISNEKGRYEVNVDGKLAGYDKGNIPSKGELNAGQLIEFIWNGKGEEGYYFREGYYRILINIWDEAGNYNYRIEDSLITIDHAGPVNIELFISDDTFSPQASPDIQDITQIGILSKYEDVTYELKINETLLYGTSPTSGLATGAVSSGYIPTIFHWAGEYGTQGVYLAEGSYTIVATIRDRAGNEAEVTTQVNVTIDNTKPKILSIVDDTGNMPRYLDQVISFTLSAEDFMGNTSILPDKGFASIILSKDTPPLATKTIMLTDFSGGVYKGFYTVSKDDIGTFTIKGFFYDKAGNPAENIGTITGKVIMRGDESIPAERSLIVRLGVLPPQKATFSITTANITLNTGSMTIKNDRIKKGDSIKIMTIDSSHIWLAKADTDGKVIVSNAELFYGFPVSDYNKLNPNAITFGAMVKNKLKMGDAVIINLTAVNIYDELPQPTTSTSTQVIFRDNRILPGKLICVYDINNHIWLGTATESGTFTISNSNLYSGNLVENYANLVGIKGIIGEFAKGGTAYANIGVITPGISLYDDGLSALHKDIIPGDGVYSNLYIIKEGKDTISLITGYFIYGSKKAENDGFKTDRKIEVDATPPLITNFGAFPGVFRIGEKDVTIKYTLKEKSDVKIEIFQDPNQTPWTSTDDILVRKLTPPDPVFGDNCVAVWDGKNEGGNLVEDDDYLFRINAIDEAGNEAIERIGVIKGTSVKPYIIDLKITPDEFVPTPHIKKDVDIMINFNVKLKATKKQLQNLGFRLDTSDIYTLPYILVHFTYFNSAGNEVKPTALPDLTEGVDTDPFTNGYPNYYTGIGTLTPLGLRPQLGGDLPDEGDGDKGNDWDILVPLDRVEGKEDEYKVDWGWGVYDWEAPKGNYSIRIWVELVGSLWKFIDYKRHEITKEEVAELWHQEPNHWKGYGVTSDTVEGSVEVGDRPFERPDSQPPIIISTEPGKDTIREYTEEIGTISATIVDEGGAGVDLVKSKIWLENSKRMTIGGRQINNGNDTIYWILEEPLTIPDIYTIMVEAIDKRDNSTGIQKFSFTIKDGIGPEIGKIKINGFELEKGVIFDHPYKIKNISVTFSEIMRGESKVDFDRSRIILQLEGPKDSRRIIDLGIPAKKKTTENAGELVYTAPFPEKLDVGTYTIYAEGWDHATPQNHTVGEEIQFFITKKGIEFIFPDNKGTRTLWVPIETRVSIPVLPTPTVIATDTIRISETTGTITGKIILGKVIEFLFKNQTVPYEIKFDQTVILEMHYNENDIKWGKGEDEVYIWWKSDKGDWEELRGINRNKQENFIWVELSELKNKYALAYSEPGVISVNFPHPRLGTPTYLKIPKYTTLPKKADRYIGTDTITIKYPPPKDNPDEHPGLKVVGSIIMFLLNGAEVSTIEFNQDVALYMHYDGEDLKESSFSKAGLKEKELALYEFHNGVWSKVEGYTVEEDKDYIYFSTKIIKGKYAIMYREPIIAERPEIFKESVCAYPNPAKGDKVTFRYYLTNNAKINIKIYTIMGDLVWSREYPATSKQGEAGGHGEYPPDEGRDIIWNCKNNAGKKVASGLYIYSITADDGKQEVTVTKKLIVIQ